MIIELKQNLISALIESKGAELKSLKKNGKEYMWSGDPKFWGKTSPVLFPAIGTLKGGKTLIDGKEYAISKHGFARDLEFIAEQLSQSEAVFTLENNEYTEKMYPFAFLFTMKYTLTDNGLKISYSIKNRSGRDMPFCIGAHPAFACPFDDNGSFEDYSIVFSDNETAAVPLYNLQTGLHEENNRTEIMCGTKKLPLRHELFYNDVLYFDKLKSRSVSLCSEKNENNVSVRFGGFETLGLWQPKDAPFLCVEPWCGSADFDDCTGVFSEKRGIQIATADEEKHYSLEINV